MELENNSEPQKQTLENIEAILAKLPPNSPFYALLHAPPVEDRR